MFIQMNMRNSHVGLPLTLTDDFCVPCFGSSVDSLTTGVQAWSADNSIHVSPLPSSISVSFSSTSVPSSSVTTLTGGVKQSFSAPKSIEN